MIRPHAAERMRNVSRNLGRSMIGCAGGVPGNLALGPLCRSRCDQDGGREHGQEADRRGWRSGPRIRHRERNSG